MEEDENEEVLDDVRVFLKILMAHDMIVIGIMGKHMGNKTSRKFGDEIAEEENRFALELLDKGFLKEFTNFNNKETE